MTRKECEDKLIELVRDAEKIYREYNHVGGQLIISTLNGHISMSGIPTGVDTETDYDKLSERYDVYATGFEDGDVWHFEKWEKLFDFLGKERGETTT